MAKLIYIANLSLDGYSEDQAGGINWGTPDEEYFNSINGLQRSVGTYLYGRRMYEAMVYWETAATDDQPAWIVELSDTWHAAEKVVFSRTLVSASSERTTLERTFDAGAIRQMKALGAQDLTVAELILLLKRSGSHLVDECHLYCWPIALGGGKHALPGDERVELQLLDELHLRSEIVHLHYRIT